jgi:hypothetical protein
VRQLAQLLPTFASFVAVSAALLWMDLWLTTTLAGLALSAVLALAPFALDRDDLSQAPPGWLDRSLDELGPVPPWLLGALHVLSVRTRRRTLVAMDLSQFAPMPKRWRDACRSALADGVFILIHPRPGAVGRHGERTAIVSDGSALRGWLPLSGRGSRTALAQFCARIAPVPKDDRFRQAIDDPDENDDE